VSQLIHPRGWLHPFTCCIDKGLAHIPQDKIQAQLREVGFDNSRQKEVVGGLSGGWKMKLELARAMLYNADLLQLDEVCHLIDMWSLPRLIPTSGPPLGEDANSVYSMAIPRWQ
jgi:ABC-type uncharacterized transport system ATPase component